MTESATVSASNISIAPASDADAKDVIALWKKCDLTRDWNDPAADYKRARKGPDSTVLIGRDGNAIVASVIVGHDGRRGAVYYVSVDPDHRKKGHGRVLMAAAEGWLRERGIEKLNLMVRAGNTHAQAFYETLDYDEQERIVYAKWLDGREPTP
jgi:ribosomal protein S18 acetylase RimI-like enzyme